MKYPVKPWLGCGVDLLMAALVVLDDLGVFGGDPGVASESLSARLSQTICTRCGLVLTSSSRCLT